MWRTLSLHTIAVLVALHAAPPVLAQVPAPPPAQAVPAQPDPFGAEVILPANTFIATAEAVSRIGAVPVPVDVDPEHLLVDPAAVEAAVTDRTRVLRSF